MIMFLAQNTFRKWFKFELQWNKIHYSSNVEFIHIWLFEDMIAEILFKVELEIEKRNKFLLLLTPSVRRSDKDFS